MHPLRSVLVYAGVVTAIYLVATHVSHLVLGRWGDLPTTYRRFPIVIPLFLGSAIIGIAVMRIVHFIGAETLFHLMVGTYHRPVLRDKVLVFVDINGSTGLAQQLGPLETRSLIGKFLFDIARPIIDHGGEIYIYKGDGLIALWHRDKAIRQNALLRAIEAMFAAVKGEQAEYQRRFGVVPTFRGRDTWRQGRRQRARRYPALHRYLWGYHQYRGAHGGRSEDVPGGLCDLRRRRPGAR